MKQVKKIYPSSKYPYYFLNKIVIPKKELIKPSNDDNDDFLTDLLFFSVSPNDENKSNNK
jgi:hypothetical protein